MDDLISLLAQKDTAKAESLASAVEEELAKLFGEGWGLKIEVSPYASGTYANLWQNELRARVRAKLEEEGCGPDEYAEWLGEVHYVRVALYLEKLFSSYKDNAGWRVTILGVPAVGVTAVGIASHYQGGQAHKALGIASNVLYDIAKDGLASMSPSIALPGRKVTPTDWDRDGLMPAPVTDVAGVDISDVAGGTGLWIGDVRNTTVKKMIASFVSIDRVPSTSTGVTTALDAIRTAAEALAG